MKSKEEDFRQRVIAASRGPLDPDMYHHLFEPDMITNGDTAIRRPESVEEFHDMIEEWKDLQLMFGEGE